jgi:hypothetical protein
MESIMPRTPARLLHLLGVSLLIVVLAAPAHAQFRSPQVAVSGSALQTFMGAQGQAIDVDTEQRLVDYWSGLYLTRPSSPFYVRSFGDGVDALVVYDSNAPQGPLFTICPGGLPSGWFTEVSFTHTPLQMIVRVYDAVGALQSTVSHPGLGFTGFGLATMGPGGVFHAFDELNPGQRAHILAFQATGPWGTWLCGENQAAANGGDFDFADAIFLLENINVTPVRHTTWGAVKQRFR